MTGMTATMMGLCGAVGAVWLGMTSRQVRRYDGLRRVRVMFMSVWVSVGAVCQFRCWVRCGAGVDVWVYGVSMTVTMRRR